MRAPLVLYDFEPDHLSSKYPQISSKVLEKCLDAAAANIRGSTGEDTLLKICKVKNLVTLYLLTQH
jgi:hypothetical protein